MKACKYRHDENYVSDFGNKKIVSTRYSCFGQKNAPPCEYRDVNDCSMAKPLYQTQFERICDRGPEDLARAIVLLMGEAVKNPKVINYDGILAALNSEVDENG